jgi:hypothetical protein
MTIEHDAGLTESKAYFRLNIFGMARYRDAMFNLGMLDNYAQGGVFPKAADFLNDTEYQEECRKVTDAEDMRPTGIPPYKLGTNDGWLVTPREIHEALENYALTAGSDRDEQLWEIASLGTEERQYWNKWILFLRRAEKHGGFRVW